MLNNVGEAEMLLASPDGAADPPNIAPRQQFSILPPLWPGRRGDTDSSRGELAFPLEKSTRWPEITNREDFEFCQKILQLVL